LPCTDYDFDLPENFSPVPRYLENAALNEGAIDMRNVDAELAEKEELVATVVSATMATNQREEPRLFCPLNFDGYLCWPRTPAGTVLSQYCPDFVEGFNRKFLAHKT